MIAFAGSVAVGVGVVPATVRVVTDDWRNTSWGFHSIERSKWDCEIAASRDGSRRESCEMQEFRHYVLLENERRSTSLYLSGPRVGYALDDHKRIYSGGPCDCAWTGYPPAGGSVQDDCAGFALEAFKMTQRTGEDRVAGYRAVRYRDKDSEGVVQEVALAPELGCAVMEDVRTYPGRLGIPGARWHSRVTSYVRGEPDPAVFRIPPGYRRGE